MKKQQTMKVGPFQWRRDDHDGSEVWDVVIPEGSGLAHFCVKNYGGKPSDGKPFSGWRVVGGGPFTSTGGWTSRDAAMKGAVPFLIRFYRQQLQTKLADAHRMQTVLELFERQLTTGKEPAWDTQ